MVADYPRATHSCPLSVHACSCSTPFSMIAGHSCAAHACPQQGSPRPAAPPHRGQYRPVPRPDRQAAGLRLHLRALECLPAVRQLHCTGSSQARLPAVLSPAPEGPAIVPGRPLKCKTPQLHWHSSRGPVTEPCCPLECFVGPEVMCIDRPDRLLQCCASAKLSSPAAATAGSGTTTSWT